MSNRRPILCYVQSVWIFACGLQVSQRTSSFIFSAGVRLVSEFLRKNKGEIQPRSQGLSS